MKKINRKTKQLCDSGITLVALIITIIILIILAAVTIKTLTHEGLINMAIKGAEDYKTAEGKELEEMNKLSDNLNSIISGSGSGNEGEKDPVIIEGVITFGDLSWTNNKASVTINKTTSDNLSIEYQVLDKNNQVIRPYTTITSGEAVTNLNLGDLVVARLTDGSNHGNTASIEVTDGEAPTAPTFGTPSGTSGNNGWYRSDVTVPINPGTDNESGVLKTTYSINGGTEVDGTSATISEDGTSTIIAYTYDNAGHKTASITLTIKIDKTAPPAVNLSFDSKTESTVTVTTENTGTDSTSGIEKYVFEYKKNTEANTEWKISKETGTLPSVYTYIGLEEATTYSFRVKTQDNAGNTNIGANLDERTNDYKEPFNPNIDTTYGGLTVDYTPKAGQVYNTEGKTSTTASGSDEYSGYEFQFFQTSDLPNGWRVWGTDDDYIYIISNNITTTMLKLKTAKGYNNGVTLLDSICDTIFTDKESYPSSKGQNLKLEQVLAITTDLVKNGTNNYGQANFSHEFNFPTIWMAHERTWENAIANRSKAYTLTVEGTGQKETSKPFTTNWSYASTWDNATFWVNSQYYDMIMTPAKKQGYWLSTRSVNSSSASYCGFGLQFIWSYGVANGMGYTIYNKTTNESLNDRGAMETIRPVVAFPKKMYTLDTTTTPAKIVMK